MPHDSSTPRAANDSETPDPGPGLGRRRLVAAFAAGAGLVVAAGLSGCSLSDPVIHGPTETPEPTASPTPDADVVAGATDEVAAQLLLTQIASGAQNGSWTVPASFAPWCQAVAEMHETHAQVLRQTDPLGGAGAQESVWVSVTPTSPAPLPADLDATLSALKTAETALAAAQARRADTVADPAMALIFLSAAIAAQAHRSTGVVAPVPAEVAPVPFEAGSPAEARQILLSHLDAAIFGFETGLGQMPFSDGRRAPALKRLDDLRAERDAVAAEIVAASATPQPARAGYELPGVVGTPDQIAALWGNLELAVLQAQARLAVSLPTGSRSAVVTAALNQVDQISRWRVPLSYWPGWV